MKRALERLKVFVARDARGDDDAGGDAETFVCEVDCIDGLRASQLVDRKRVAFNTASTATRSSGRLIEGSCTYCVKRALE